MKTLDEFIVTLYADLAGTLLVICGALERKGVISQAELSEALRQHLASMQAVGPYSARDLPLLAQLSEMLRKPTR
jgi:hypothetical protein